MTKWMLLKYEMETFQALNVNGIGYELTITVSSWWGLFKKTRVVKAVVPYSVKAEEAYGPLLNKWVTPKQAKEIVDRRKK